MSEVLPEVRMVCLYADRPQFLRRFLASFRAQTYPNLRLLIYDNGREPIDTGLLNPGGGDREIWINAREASHLPARSIGMLRNQANSWANADIIAHADVDDVSHPNRLAEQVTLLQASGADCVGYSDMLFWDTRKCVDITRDQWTTTDEAWLYLGPQKALGTSLAYWRRTWERKPFPDQPRPGHASGEDTDWIKDMGLVTEHSLGLYAPRMIASIHGANTSGSYKLIGNSTSWMRVPEFDKYCRKAMAL